MDRGELAAFHWKAAEFIARKAGGTFSVGPIPQRGGGEHYGWEALIGNLRYGCAIDVVTERNKQNLGLQAFEILKRSVAAGPGVALPDLPHHRGRELAFCVWLARACSGQLIIDSRPIPGAEGCDDIAIRYRARVDVLGFADELPIPSGPLDVRKGIGEAWTMSLAEGILRAAMGRS